MLMYILLKRVNPMLDAEMLPSVPRRRCLMCQFTDVSMDDPSQSYA